MKSIIERVLHILLNMETYTIMFNTYTPAIESVRKRFIESDIKYITKEQGKGRTEIVFLGNRELFEKLATELTCCIYKHKYLTLYEDIVKTKDVVYYALTGITIGIGLSGEKEEIKKLLPKGNAINIDGFCNFSISEMVLGWKSLGLLMNKLYINCLDSHDKRALIEYFYSKGREEERTLVLDGGIYYNDNNQDIPLYDFYGEYEKDLTVTLFSLLPKEIIVRRPDKFDRKFIEFITELGK